MPLGMAGPIQAVVISDHVYVGGGDNSQPETVMVYSIRGGSWSTLSPHETKLFGMAAMNSQLILVGGSRQKRYKAANIIAVYDVASKTWSRPFPDMPTARHSVSTIVYKKWLLLAGGYVNDERDSQLRKVEILDTVSGHWYNGPSLPHGCSEMSSAIAGNMWYLLGGFSSQSPQCHKHVFRACLDELISQALSQSASCSSRPRPSPWLTLPDTPLPYSTALILNGALLTLGGYNSLAIHIYQHGSRRWITAHSSLPTHRQRCACTVLPNGEVFIAGGHQLLRNQEYRCADTTCKRVDFFTTL